MKLPPLTRARLIRRRNRFVAEAEFPDGSLGTAYCPNTGRMLGCSQPGSTIFLSRQESPKRKHPFTWELTRTETSLVGVNTARTNAIVREGLESLNTGKWGEYANSKPEVKVSPHSRLDFRLDRFDSGPPCYMEVKNCTLVRDGVASFPDAVTQRGSKHLQELICLVESGYFAAVFFLVQRSDAKHFVPAGDIDPEYASWLALARSRGVDAVCYDVLIQGRHIRMNRELPVYPDHGFVPGKTGKEKQPPRGN